jgi:hypothetical protein
MQSHGYGGNGRKLVAETPVYRCVFACLRMCAQIRLCRNRLYIERKWGHSWLWLGPRIAGYLLKGARNAALLQTLHALRAAIRLSAGVRQECLSAGACSYLRAADTAHRGSLLLRLRREVLGMLPTPPAARPR